MLFSQTNSGESVVQHERKCVAQLIEEQKMMAHEFKSIGGCGWYLLGQKGVIEIQS